MDHRRFQQLASLWLIGVGVLLLIMPDRILPDFYHPAYMGVVALLSPILVHLPSFGAEGRGVIRRRALLRLRSVIAFSIIVNMLGELGFFQLYRIGFEYDKFAHFVVSMLFASAVFKVLVEWKRFRPALSVAVAVAVVFGSGLLWEIFEYSSDALFGTHEWGVYGRDTLSDTFKDIFFNTLGIFFGTTLFGTGRRMRSNLPLRK